jgi:cobalamin-dependent methionine synthase I
MIWSAIEDAGEMFRAKAEYAVFEGVKFNNLRKTIEINEIVFEVNRIVYSQLTGSDSMAVFLCTAGPEISSRSRQAMEAGDILTGYLYDVIGSEIVGAAAHLMQKELEISMSAAGKKVTNRYNPGYCDWKVDEQQKLFRLMQENYCGIRLNSSALMDPEKSVSGFIGIGSDVRFNSYTCGLCERMDCIYREIQEKR